IADDADTGVQEITVTDETTGLFTTMKYTVLEADDQVTEPALIIDPEEITLDDFVGEPDDGAGVAHTVEASKPAPESPMWSVVQKVSTTSSKQRTLMTTVSSNSSSPVMTSLTQASTWVTTPPW